jgi:pectate lyase
MKDNYAQIITSSCIERSLFRQFSDIMKGWSMALVHLPSFFGDAVMKTSFAIIASLLFLLSSASYVLAVDGWASMAGGTSGGAGGPTITVTNEADLQYYAEQFDPYIIQVQGTIVCNSPIWVKSNTTIIGLGSDATVDTSFLLRMEGGVPISNVIFRNLTITNPRSLYEGDGIQLKYAIQNVWIDHCTLIDCDDGMVDITRQSDYVTISWCKFYYTYDTTHNFVNLIGHDPDYTDDRGYLHVTMHHNWWGNLCIERMPRVRFGQVHVYNNYFDTPDAKYNIGVGREAQIRVENNYFDGVRDDCAWKQPAEYAGQIGWNGGNVFVNTTLPTWATNEYDTIFTPPYSYTLDDGLSVPGIVMAGAGPTLGGDTTPPVPPTGLATTAGYVIVSLDWNDNNEPDLAGYNVYRSTTSGGPYTGPLNGSLLNDPNYDDEIVTHDTTYYYVVTAVDTNSNESGYSNEVFSGLYGDFTGNGVVEINDLSDFFAFWLADNCYDTSWLDLDDDCAVDFYEYSVLANNAFQGTLPPQDTTPPTPNPMTWQSVPAAVDDSSIMMTATTATDISGVEYYFANITDPTHDSGWQASPTYTDTSLAASTEYTYRVIAHDLSPSLNETDWSANASATTLEGGDDTTPPAAPTSLSGNQNNNDVVLNWADNSEPDLAGYNVYRSQTSGSGYIRLNSSLVIVSAYTDVNGGGYYVVTAVDTSLNESEYSNQVHVSGQQ